MNHQPKCSILLVVLFTLIHLTAFGQKADIILTNGKIFTADSKQLYVQALAIRGNKILAVGTNKAIEELASPTTKRIDLKGRTVTPGFNDAHDHLGWYAPIGLGYRYTETNSSGLSKAAVLDSIARLVKSAKQGQWISGFIGTTILDDSSMRGALDSIAPNNPVLLQIWWGHGQVVNQKALEAVGISDASADPVGGWYIKTKSKITAVHQNAQLPFWTAWSISEPEKLIAGLQSYTQEQLRGGITTVQQMSSTLNGKESVRVFGQADLPQRIRIIAWPHTTPNGRKLWEWDMKNAQINPKVLVSGIKYTIDGSPMERNALRTTPYEGTPDWYGRLNYPVDTIKQILREALSSNRQLIMHMTADSSLKTILSLMQQVGSAAEWKTKRVRFEHNCMGEFSAEQRKAFRDMGIILMHTSWYCMASPLRSLLDDGIVLGIAPDGTTNPFIEIMLMTSTHANPKENLTVEQAVIAYTRTNAYAEFQEKVKGTLAKGMLADLVVLSQDIFTIAPQQLPATQSVLTMIDGKIVYQQ